MSNADLSLMRYLTTPVWHNGVLAGVLLAGGIVNGKVRIGGYPTSSEG
jgi:hypothetical protein